MNHIKKVLDIKTAPAVAYRKFINDINAWWPQAYTWSQGQLQEIKIDGKVNGLCTEIGPYGFRCDWGRVTGLIENEKIGLKWQISANREPIPNPEHASDITVLFTPKADHNTTLQLEHFNFENHGNTAEHYQQMMDSEYGWDYILDCFKVYCEG